jgi:transmembrane sensor
MNPQNADDMRADPVRREAHAWVRRLISGDATVADAEALKRWCEASAEHAAAFAEAQRLWRDMEPASRKLLARSRSSSGSRSAVSARGWSRRAFLGGAVTATAAAVVATVVHPSFALWPSEWGADYRTATGEQKKLQLADGLSVALNTQTSVALQAADGGMGGIRLIAGEAAIDSDVRLAQPFSVAAGNGRAWTQERARFEVRHDRDAICVTCLAGVVEVEHGTQRLTLRQRQRVFYDADGMRAPFAVDPSLSSAWREGVVVFRRTPLSEAVTEINRYRPGRVLLLDEELGKQVVSGRFGIGDMDRVIAQIQQAFGANVTALPGNMIVLS